MAEGMAAAGLASSVVTFIEFGVKPAKLTKQVYDAHGELPKDLQKCQSTVDELSDWVRHLRSRHNANDQPLTRCDLALKNALDYCLDDCDELQEILEAILLNAKPGKPSASFITVFRTVIRSMRRDRRIQKVQKGLENHKNELRLRIAERTMEMVEETRETGNMHFSVTRNIDRRQIEVQGESRKTGARMINIQQANHAEIRGMHSDTTQLLTAARQENRELGNRLRDLYVADQNDIVAFVAQNNERFDQVHDSLGLMELDLEGIKLKGDETLLVVKQLANVINARGEGSAAIYIRVPRALYDPALSVWNGYRTYVEKGKQLSIPGAWTMESIDHVYDRQLGKFSGRDARAAYLAVTSQRRQRSFVEFEREVWTKNLIGPTWSTWDFQAAYGRNQSWLSYFLCFDMAGIQLVPLLKDSATDDGEGSIVYKTWSQIVIEGPAMIEQDTAMAENENGKGEGIMPKSNETDSEFSTSIGETRLYSDFIGELQPGNQVIELEPQIRRRDTDPKDIPGKSSNLNAWIHAIETQAQLQGASSLQPFIKLNEKLQSITTTPPNSTALKHTEHNPAFRRAGVLRNARVGATSYLRARK